MTNLSDYDPVKMAIGAALQNSEICRQLISLRDSDFEDQRDVEIVNAMRVLTRENTKIDFVVVGDRTNGKYTDYLIDAVSMVPSTINAGAYIGAIKDNAQRRRLKEAATALYQAADDKMRSVEEISATTLHAIETNDESSAGSITTTEALSELMDEFDKAHKPRARFGIPLLDRTIGGMMGGRLYVLGARPAVGKSALALTASTVTSIDGTVLMCSYEMQASEIMGRIMSGLSGVSSENIAHRLLTDEEHHQLIEYYPKAMEMQIRFLRGSTSLEAVRVEALRLKKKTNLRLIVVDYLQLMSSGMKSESRRIEVGQISRGLKQLAMELDLPVLALSQLNRVSELTQSRVPNMSEMRESGDIEQDADVIVLMYKPRTDADEEEPDDNSYTCVRLLVEKNRQGHSGVKIDTAFDGAHMRFVKMSEVTA